MKVNWKSHRLSLIKAISWRLFGSLDTMLISYFFTGSASLALGIGGVEVVTKTILYYLHERAWIKASKL
ncbi:MAG: DUF2061 domain-containing protein [Flavobacteriaceae bacterium]|nr:DUF2061 domain-containing protein [Flavobacteriaceae bacterium]